MNLPVWAKINIQQNYKLSNEKFCIYIQQVHAKNVNHFKGGWKIGTRVLGHWLYNDMIGLPLGK